MVNTMQSLGSIFRPQVCRILSRTVPFHSLVLFSIGFFYLTLVSLVSFSNSYIFNIIKFIYYSKLITVNFMKRWLAKIACLIYTDSFDCCRIKFLVIKVVRSCLILLTFDCIIRITNSDNDSGIRIANSVGPT